MKKCTSSPHLITTILLRKCKCFLLLKNPNYKNKMKKSYPFFTNETSDRRIRYAPHTTRLNNYLIGLKDTTMIYEYNYVPNFDLDASDHYWWKVQNRRSCEDQNWCILQISSCCITIFEIGNSLSSAIGIISYKTRRYDSTNISNKGK